MDWDQTVPLPCFYLAAKVEKVLVFHSSSGCPVGGGPQYIHLSSVLPPSFCIIGTGVGKMFVLCK